MLLQENRIKTSTQGMAVENVMPGSSFLGGLEFRPLVYRPHQASVGCKPFSWRLATKWAYICTLWLSGSFLYSCRFPTSSLLETMMLKCFKLPNICASGYECKHTRTADESMCIYLVKRCAGSVHLPHRRQNGLCQILSSWITGFLLLLCHVCVVMVRECLTVFILVSASTISLAIPLAEFVSFCNGIIYFY